MDITNIISWFINKGPYVGLSLLGIAGFYTISTIDDEQIKVMAILVMMFGLILISNFIALSDMVKNT